MSIRDDLYVPFARPDTGEDEVAAVREVILGGWLTTSQRCREFEQAFAERVGARHAVALNSCTAALHLALEAVGVERGDLVVTTAYTFAATAEVIRYFDAVPVLVDVDPDTFNLDPVALEDVVGRLAAGDRSALPPAVRDRVEAKTPRAVIPVHIAGAACQLDRIYKLAAASGMAVVEDAAHAFPAAYRSRPIGSITDPNVASAVCFSFYATKTITTGEGGMLVTDSPEIAARARQMSLHGLTHDAWGRYGKNAAWRYDIDGPGFKYNMTDIAAAIGLVQLDRAEAMTDRRRAIASRYNEAFADVPGLETPLVPDDVCPSWHLYMLRVSPSPNGTCRDHFVDQLVRRGVGTSVHFIPLHLHSYYQRTLGYAPDDLPHATAEFEREISLPIYSAMTDDEVDHVCDAVLDVATRFAA